MVVAILLKVFNTVVGLLHIYLNLCTSCGVKYLRTCSICRDEDCSCSHATVKSAAPIQHKFHFQQQQEYTVSTT